ncbi:hypothetical protein B0H67DRAFT_604088 [Lasiosphaeris hirsuta]|uniref:Dimethylaniline monooxygenase n=1 Tax=Lasiosphaeris hirsuta TaxID=260670 RepID=A0AA40DLH2_9PEZI|nr:hypothetical protein B0H67DRAFT_604088 [Lasiosphaeris hirsuta]
MKVIVIGGGAAGLTSLKYLTTAHQFYPDLDPIEARLFEAEDSIGGVFQYRAWRGGELVSSKFLTTFSDFRLPEDTADFIGLHEFKEYLLNYALHFKLYDYIRCKAAVSNVRPREDGQPGHLVTVFYRDTQQYSECTCDAVIVCSGLHLTPSFPDTIPGLLAVPPATPPRRQTRQNTASSWVIPAKGAVFAPSGPDVSWMHWISSTKAQSLRGAAAAPRRSFRLLHSSEFKNRDGPANEFLNADGTPSTVVILGGGETAHDIAYFAVNNPGVGRVVMSTRDGFFLAPKVTPEPIILKVWGRPYPGKRPNKPIDTTIASLFDTAYVPPLLQRSMLLWDYYDAWVRGMFAAICGTTGGFDQWVGRVSSQRDHVDSFFVVKTDKAIPYISAPYRGGFWNTIRAFLINIPIKDNEGRVIELAPWPTSIKKVKDYEKEVMEFPDTGSPESEMLKKKEPVQPDVVIVSTGYRREFPFLDDKYPKLRECRVRGVYDKIEDGIAFVGFVRPAIGAIPPLAELQAQLWISRYIEHHLATKQGAAASEKAGLLSSPFPRRSKNAVPHYELDYKMHPRGGYDLSGNRHGVDHESYAYQLAVDMGAAPTATHVLRRHGWKVFYTWAMGSNFNIKFRLVGPWAIPHQAGEIMRSELWNVVSRTGGVVFVVTYTIIPQVIFGILSLLIMGGAHAGRVLRSLLKLLSG